MNEILFGTAYYHEYMPYDRVEKDLDMMKKAGMNVIRIGESTWSTMEAKDGVFDFSTIERVLEVARKKGMKVIIGTPTYAIPHWLALKDADVMVTDDKGRAAYGKRQLINLLNPTFLFHAERIIRQMMERFANHSTVIGFQIDNETKHYNSYSSQFLDGFKDHLIEKFTDVGDMNRAYGLDYWSNAVSSWDTLPNVCGTINGGFGGEYDVFRRKVVTDYLAWQVSIVNEYKSDVQFITHNFDFDWKGHSYGVQADVNHWLAAKELTLAGTDIYHPSQDNLTGAEISFCGDEIRNLKNDSYLVLETQSQAFKDWTPYPGQLRLQAYSHLASGAKGLLYWNWHSIHNSYETYWKGILSHDLKVNPVYEEALMIGHEWQEIGSDHLCIEKKNKLALVIDNQSLTALEWFPIDEKLSYNDVVRWVYDSLYEMNIECDLVHAIDLEARPLEEWKYEVIITPALYCASSGLVEMLDTFVKNGGVLVSTFKSFVANRNSTVYHEPLPYGLTDCFGMTYNQVVDAGKTKIMGKHTQYIIELLKLNTAKSIGDYEHQYWSEYSGMTGNNYGKGWCFYIGCFTEKSVLKSLLYQAIGNKGLEDTEFDNGNTVWPLITKSGTNSVGKVVQYVLNYSSDRLYYKNTYGDVLELISKRRYKRGERIELKDWGVLVLEVWEE